MDVTLRLEDVVSDPLLGTHGVRLSITPDFSSLGAEVIMASHAAVLAGLLVKHVEKLTGQTVPRRNKDDLEQAGEHHKLDPNG